MTEAKVDFKKEIASYAAKRGVFDVITVPLLQYLMIDGHGDPNTAQEYKNAVETLFPVAYALKFFSKRELARGYTVMPLEALWSADDMTTFITREKSAWDWTSLNLVPDWITTEHFGAAVEAVARKGGAPALDLVRLEQLDEGLCVQTLHVGSYDDEAPVLQQLHKEVIPARSLRETDRHHEIYLSDPRRVAPEKLRTILRQPVAPVP